MPSELGSGFRRRRGVAWLPGLAAAAALGVCSPAAGQISGVVTDLQGRPLPFAVVVSRTGNGFVALRAGADGRFTFPRRPHRAGDRIEARTAGYRRGQRVIAEGDSTLTVVLERADAGAQLGWTIGLPVDPVVVVRGPDGEPVADGDPVRAGDAYRVSVTVRVPEACAREGPRYVGSGDQIVVVLGVFVSDRQCEAGSGEFEQTIEHVFDHPGPAAIRVVGRHRDVTRRLLVVPSG